MLHRRSWRHLERRVADARVHAMGDGIEIVDVAAVTAIVDMVSVVAENAESVRGARMPARVSM